MTRHIVNIEDGEYQFDGTFWLVQDEAGVVGATCTLELVARQLVAAPALLAACVLGPGFHADGATLLEEAAYYLQHSHPQLADELKRKAAIPLS